MGGLGWGPLGSVAGAEEEDGFAALAGMVATVGLVKKAQFEVRGKQLENVVVRGGERGAVGGLGAGVGDGEEEAIGAEVLADGVGVSGAEGGV